MIIPTPFRANLLRTAAAVASLPLFAAAQGLPPSNHDESKVLPYKLPDLFTMTDGTPVKTPASWLEKRRPELLEIFRKEVYGIAPPKPENLAFRVVDKDEQAIDGKATRKQVEISFKLGDQPFSFGLALFIPNGKKSPSPVFILLNHRGVAQTDPTRVKKSEFWPAETLIARGYAIAAVNVSADVEPDEKQATTGIRSFYRKHHPQPDAFTWGALSAWAWAGSRAMDYFETDPAIDARKVAVIGHSRSGKTALWAAAQDTRFALACVNCSGEGGAALSRRNFGESLHRVTYNFPHWFTPKYATYAGKVDSLPIDQHELIALIAPRGYHGGDAVADPHADPRGSYLSLVEASKAWGLLGIISAWKDEPPATGKLLMEGPLAYHIREGKHDLNAINWKNYLDHADQLFRKVPASK